MIQKTRYTDRQLLLAHIIEALVKAEERLNRPPSRKEIFHELFPGGGQDPETLELQKKLSPMVAELLDEWFAPAD